jgi:prepilin-type N-terminal cleavage/methylation domain-containing protein
VIGTRAEDSTHNRQSSIINRQSRRAFTLIEMLVALTVIAAVAAVVVPLMSDQSRLRVMAAAGVLSSDIELAQVMTIAHPDEPVVVRFDPDGGRYWLAYASDPETPLPREDTGEDYMIIFGAGRARGALGVTLTVEDVPGNALTFAAHGGLADFTISPRVKMANGSRGIQLAITPNTGSITETEFTPEQGPIDQPR